jgi:hypothetical protein
MNLWITAPISSARNDGVEKLHNREAAKTKKQHNRKVVFWIATPQAPRNDGNYSCRFVCNTLLDIL